MEEYKAIAVIDSSVGTLTIYDMPKAWDSETIEVEIIKLGHRLSQVSWGEFDGTINDRREI